jgi:ABC-2 type transport system ATP-binding protein
MSKGEIVASGTPDELKARLGSGRLRLRVRNTSARAAEAVDLAIRRGVLPSSSRYLDEDSVIEVRGELGDCSVDRLVYLLEDFEIGVVDMRWGNGSLDDVFTQLAEATVEESQLQPVTVEHRALARRGGRR